MSEKLTGLLSEFHLSDIIQLLIMTQKAGELALRDLDRQKTALLYFEKGNLVHAALDSADGQHSEGLRAFQAIIGWDEGEFKFLAGKQTPKVTIRKTSQETLIDTLARMDDIKEMNKELPTEDINLFIKPELDIVPSISVLEWRVLALVNGRRTIQRICQKFGDELEAKRVLRELVRKGLVSADPPESDWRRLVPSIRSAAEVEYDRALPPRVRTNLLFRAIDGKTHFEDIRRKLQMDENDLLEDMKLLYELKWVKLSPDDERAFLKHLADL
ncbi:DUF4388 domain-containing protein [bacterium]|nr:DUF4388 domain-containing protein [bacterium]